VFNVPIFIAIACSPAARTRGRAGVSQALIPIGTFLTQCLVGPLMTIGTSLIYYDQRVRREAFDLQHMMSRSTAHLAKLQRQRQSRRTMVLCRKVLVVLFLSSMALRRGNACGDDSP